MRVLVLSSTFPSVAEPTRGVFIFERMRRVARRSELVVVAPVPWFPLNQWFRGRMAAVPSVESRDGLTVYHPRFLSIPRYGKFLDGVLYALCLLPFLARLRRTFAFELIDAHFEYPDAVAATLLGCLLRRPVVVTLRGKLVRLAGYPLHRPQLRWMLRRADRVVAVSGFLRDLAVGLGIARDRVRVVRNGVDAAQFAPLDRTEARARCGLPAEGPILLTVGGLDGHKGQHMVVDALPGLLRMYPAMSYVIIGDGRPGNSYEKTLRHQVVTRGLERHVRFVGGQPHDSLRAWFCAADLSILLTKSEGWPNVVLESLACGVPVVATRVGGVPEIVRDGTDGILVPYGDTAAFGSAVRDALGRRWDREGIVRYAHSLDWSEVTEQVLEEFEAAVKGARLLASEAEERSRGMADRGMPAAAGWRPGPISGPANGPAEARSSGGPGLRPVGPLKLSVIVPVFNERYLVRELLRRVTSVTAPGVSQFEIIVVDDGSTRRDARDPAQIAAAEHAHHVHRARAQPGQGRGDPHRHRGGHRRPDRLPGRRPGVRPARLRAAGAALPRGRRGRGLRLALPAQRAAARALLPAHAGQPAAHLPQQLVHRPQPDRHGDLLQDVPGAAPQVDPHPLERLRDGARDHGQDRQARVPDLRGADQLPRAAPTARARRSAGKDGFKALRGDHQVLAHRRPLHRGRVRLPHPAQPGATPSASTAGWPTRSRRYVGARVLEIGAGIGNITSWLLPRDRYVATDINPHYLDYLRNFAARQALPRGGATRPDATRQRSSPGAGSFDTVVCLNVLEHVPRPAVGSAQHPDCPGTGRSGRPLRAPGPEPVLAASTRCWGTAAATTGRRCRPS